MTGFLDKIPRPLFALMKESAKYILRHPVVGVAAVAKTREQKYVLVRRADTGTWALPGGTQEWGETLEHCLRRELLEEAGVAGVTRIKLAGVYSAPYRDDRFHSTTVVVCCDVDDPLLSPKNRLEILEVSTFSEAQLPSHMAFTQREMFLNAFRGELVFE